MKETGKRVRQEQTDNNTSLQSLPVVHVSLAVSTNPSTAHRPSHTDTDKSTASQIQSRDSLEENITMLTRDSLFVNILLPS